MIQRIQSIYFLLAAIFMAVTVCSPLLLFNLAQGKFTDTLTPFGVYGISVDYPTWGILTFAILGALLPFINIFLFKNRKRQVRIGNITVLAIILFYISVATYSYFFMNKGDVVFQNIQYGIILPCLALIFNILGVISVKKDEKKVRSLDRIR